MSKKRRSDQEVTTETEPVAVITAGGATPVKDLRISLEEIRSYDGVVGYILRNSTSASIDLKDPTKIIDYAVLSSSAIDASEELSELFDLGEVRSIRVDGASLKVLSLLVGENKVSIFMEKKADSERILKRLRVP